MKFLEEKLNSIKKETSVCGIILVGSSVKRELSIKELKESGSDIDIFVIRDSGRFEREVIYIDHIEVDISFISVSEISYAIDEELSSLISVLSNYREIYIEKEAEDILSHVKEAYIKGPSRYSNYHIDYLRFKLTKSIESLERKVGDIGFDILAFGVLKEILKFHFKLNKLWIPADKNLIWSLKSEKLKELSTVLLKEGSNHRKLMTLDKILDLELESVGGRKYNWDRSEYPFDFD